MHWGSDPRKDLLVGLSDGRVKLYTNVGTEEAPTFDGGTQLQVGPAGSKVPIDVGARATATAVDWNADGRKDLVVGAYDGRIHVFLNAGSDTLPEFESETFAQDSGSDLDVPSARSSPHVLDVDDDGVKDLVAGNTNGELLFYRNTGSDSAPAFSGHEYVLSDSLPIDLPGLARSRPYVCDWNADGLLDVLIGGGDGLVRLYPGTEEDTGVPVLWAANARMLPAYPNPFNPRVTVAYELRARSGVRVSVYDVAGRRVADLADTEAGPGIHRIVWDGRSAAGTPLPSGVYLVRMDSDGQAQEQKVVLLR